MLIRRILSWTAVLLWMLLIFKMSSQPAEQSNELSTGITYNITQYISNIFPDTDFDIYTFNHIIRKSAHFFTYFVLGVLTVNALSIKNFLRFKNSLIALLICSLYAISDEVHQLYVPGRGGQVRDVLIDTAGSITGIAFYILFLKRSRKYPNKLEEP